MILSIALDLPVRRLFDYFPPHNEVSPEPGQRVQVTCGGTRRCGIVITTSLSSDLPVSKIRLVENVLEDMPKLSPPLLALIKYTAGYYFLPPGKVAFAALPEAFRRPRLASLDEIPATPAALRGNNGPASAAQSPPIALNNFEHAALASLANNPKPLLLTGLTGANLRRLVVQAAARTIKAGHSALLISPSNALADQLCKEINILLPSANAVAWHSDMTARERLSAWLAAAKGQARAVVGARASVFAPLQDVKLITVIDEHSPAHRAWQGLSYSSRDVAAQRSLLEPDCRLLLTAAAQPSLELRQAVGQQRIRQAILKPSSDQPALPSLTIADIAKRRLFGGISAELENGLRRELARQGTAAVLVIHGRRGGLLFCTNCRRIPRCRRCGDHLLANGENCRCRRCAAELPLMSCCKICGESSFEAMRAGSTRVLEALSTRLPEAKLTKLEASTDLAALRTQLDTGKIDIVVGGPRLLDLERSFGSLLITDADTMLLAPELRSVEQMLEITMRLTSDANTPHVVIQTRFPEHHVFAAMRKGGYQAFVEQELKERRLAGLPPYRRLALLKVEAASEDDASSFLGGAKQLAQSLAYKNIYLMSPVDSPGRGADSKTRMQLLLSAPDRKTISSMLSQWVSLLEERKNPPKLDWSIVVDPEKW